MKLRHEQKLKSIFNVDDINKINNKLLSIIERKIEKVESVGKGFDMDKFIVIMIITWMNHYPDEKLTF